MSFLQNTKNQRNNNISVWFDHVYAALWPRLDIILPEFDFRLVGGVKWVGRSRLHLDGALGRDVAGVTCWQNNPGRLIDYARGNMTIWQYMQTRGGMDAKSLFAWFSQISGINQPDGVVSGRVGTPVRNFSEGTERLELLKKKRAIVVAEARRKAAEIWNSAAPSAVGHPYLEAKGLVSAPSVRRLASIAKSFWFNNSRLKGDLEDVILVPLMDSDGLSSLQAIDKDGNKFFMAGGDVKGKWLILQGMAGAPMVLCEGWATGVSIRESTGYSVVVAFNCGNLAPVAEAMLENDLLAGDILIASDNDPKSDGKNPGVDAAVELASKTGWTVLTPFFDTLVEGSDWNDFANLRGRDALAKHFGAV